MPDLLKIEVLKFNRDKLKHQLNVAYEQMNNCLQVKDRFQRIDRVKLKIGQIL